MDAIDRIKSAGEQLMKPVKGYARYEEGRKNVESVPDGYESSAMPGLHAFGDLVRTVDDEARTALVEYGGGGWRGQLFADIATLERYDLAASMLQENPERVEEDVGSLVDAYRERCTEQYGVPVERYERFMNAVLDPLEPFFKAYGSDDAVELVTAIDDTVHQVKAYMEPEEPENDVEPIDIGPLVHGEEAAAADDD